MEEKGDTCRCVADTATGNIIDRNKYQINLKRTIINSVQIFPNTNENRTLNCVLCIVPR